MSESETLMKFALLAFLVIPPATLWAQGPEAGVVRPNEVTLFAEPAAGGAQYLYYLGQGWRGGVTVTAGPTYGVRVSKELSGDIRNWGSAYATIGFRTRGGIEANISPIGVAAIIGNDFGTVYPSGQGYLGVARGRLRAGSVLRVIRIAGGNGSGEYWTQWVPLRVGIVLGR